MIESADHGFLVALINPTLMPFNTGYAESKKRQMVELSQHLEICQGVGRTH